MEKDDGDYSPSGLTEGPGHIADTLPDDDGSKENHTGQKTGIAGTGPENPAEGIDRSRIRRLPWRPGRGTHCPILWDTCCTYRRAAFARREPTSQIGPGKR